MVDELDFFLDSVFGVPSTLLFIFGAGVIFSMPNSELGGIPGVLLAMLPPIGYGPGPPWFIIPCMLFIPGPYAEPAPIMPWDMLG